MENFNIKIFCDGADKKSILDLASKSWISGFTTNPTLMKKAGITDYKSFALDVLQDIKDRPISFEVFSDEFSEMKDQALEIASWASNVYVKIPITNTKGESSLDLVEDLSHGGVKVNVTAVFTLTQINESVKVLTGGAPSILSVFAGRIADAGIDPTYIMMEALAACMKADKNIELLWASPREIFNIIQAQNIGCHIITVPPDILAKVGSLGKDLTQFSLETVKMFYNDAQAAGFKI